ncbi:MAG: cytochrome b N-terminal domain-containing protein [Candidatus Brocadiales bacterium]
MSRALAGPKEPTRLRKFIKDNFFERLLPKKLSWFRCLGGLALVTFIVQVATGIYLLFFYDPSPLKAFNSVQHIKHAAPYGWLASKLHLVGAQIMIGLVIAHLIRVLFKGAYKRPRELNWVSGASLLMLVLYMGYTGTTLPFGNVHPWNAENIQNSSQAYASTVGYGTTTEAKNEVEIPAGATRISNEGLPSNYILHVLVIPLIICTFMAFHFTMTRRTGISEPL